MTGCARLPSLIDPYGGSLATLLVAPEARAEAQAHASQLPAIQLSARSVCDLELLATGAFSPLERFMSQEDYRRVLAEMRLSSGVLFPLPVTLPVDPAPTLHLDQQVALRDSKNDVLAVMTIAEIFPGDPLEAAQQLCGTLNARHPLVAEMQHWGRWNISGPLRVLQLPRHYDFQTLRLTPAQTRARLRVLGYAHVVACQTPNPLHRAHEELTKRAIQEVGGALLLQPVVGLARPDDVEHYTRIRAYRALAAGYYDAHRILLSLLPLATRMAGPREALWQALISRNYGANYCMVGRAHADPGHAAIGQLFYGPHEAQELLQRYGPELGVRSVPCPEWRYLPDEERSAEVSGLTADRRMASLSATQVREQYLHQGRRLPEWFVRPEVAEILAETYPPRYRQGVCVWLTGLSGAGKSTTAEVLTVFLLEHGRQVTVLDGDVVRTHLSRGLGFSKEDRDTNIRRIGFVAAEIVRHGGVVVCAAVSPYRATRREVRHMVGPAHFVEVFVDTPLEVCEARDTKGMYARARRGELKEFTGVDDPYEPPEQPEIRLDTVTCTPEANAQRIVQYLEQAGFVRPQAEASGHSTPAPCTDA